MTRLGKSTFVVLLAACSSTTPSACHKGDDPEPQAMSQSASGSEAPGDDPSKATQPTAASQDAKAEDGGVEELSEATWHPRSAAEDRACREREKARVKYRYQEEDPPPMELLPGQKPMRLRSEPEVIAIRTKVMDTMFNLGMYESRFNPDGCFSNAFVVHDHRTVSDAATGLMWDRRGSEALMTYEEAEKYVSNLNSGKFSGYNDWRLPTVEEAGSLMHKATDISVSVDPAMKQRKRTAFWLADRDIRSPSGHWVATLPYGFSSGGVSTRSLVRVVRTEHEATYRPEPVDSTLLRCREQERKRQRDKDMSAMPKSPYQKALALRSVVANIGRDDVNTAMRRHGFFHRNVTERECFWNAYIPGEDGTVFDRATGLRWVRKEGPSTQSVAKITKYINSLNGQRFAGFDDWRLPTLEEAGSLIETGRLVGPDGRHIDPLMEQRATRMWTADTDVDSEKSSHWLVSFVDAVVLSGSQRSSRDPQAPSVHAVRTER